MGSKTEDTVKCCMACRGEGVIRPRAVQNTYLFDQMCRKCDGTGEIWVLATEDETEDIPQRTQYE